MIDWNARRRQLRADDPRGLRSDNQIDHQIEIEKLHYCIYQLQPSGDFEEGVREILSDIVGRLEVIGG